MDTWYKGIKPYPILAILGLFFVLGNDLQAQSTDTKILGFVLDENNDPVIGANIAVTNSSTGFYTGTVSDLDGSYEMRELPLGGPYTISVSYTGYQPVEKTGLILSFGDEVNLNFNLKIGTELETIVVSSNNLKSRTDRMGSALAITGKTINTIPTPTRNFEQLSSLSPVGYVADVGSRNFGGAGVNGVKGGQTGYTVDGGNTRRMVFGGYLRWTCFYHFSRSYPGIRNFYQ